MWSARCNGAVDRVEIEAHSPSGEPLPPCSAACALITLPLSILQLAPDAAGAVRFLPSLEMKQAALSRLAMGPAVHVTLVFREAFWHDAALAAASGGLADMLFLFSDNPWFPTWWSKRPSSAPALTGWCAGPRAKQFCGQPSGFVEEKAIQALSGILEIPSPTVAGLLHRSYVHDWQADAFCRGGYSYVVAGGAEQAQRHLAAPVENTLFFAGEATNFQGHHATVHGALASGYRAAGEVLATHPSARPAR